ncbi:nuclease-related domain-containing protein [Macrococcus carouselicus]|uniref:NERD domain-containing protein n=1 Tax=Macrococcus carouselicus TaxID=69969 RepID=A0A9Q8FPU2_9STAP|nr:nuclease-related domain-containing protein [Macrococcus carouselicus]TDM04625.1 NERD domain-containing protein [Macrococcus carouselicus]
MDFSQLTPLHYGLIALTALALLFLILWLLSASKRRREQEELLARHESDRQSLTTTLEEKAEQERRAQAEQFSKERQALNNEIADRSTQIDSLKLLSKDGGEYLTDFTLIQLKDRLVRNERIRPEDMHVLANIFLPGRDLKRTERLAHLVMTRTGVYLLESHYWKGHIYHGVDQTQFSVDPMFEHVFSLLALDQYIEQTIAMERDEERDIVYFRSLKHNIEDLKRRAELLQEKLHLQYPVTPIMYFNKEGHDAGTMDNYSRDKNVKVIVGEEELETFFEKYVFHGRFQYSVEELATMLDEIEHLNP